MKEVCGDGNEKIIVKVCSENAQKKKSGETNLISQAPQALWEWLVHDHQSLEWKNFSRIEDA